METKEEKEVTFHSLFGMDGPPSEGAPQVVTFEPPVETSEQQTKAPRRGKKRRKETRSTPFALPRKTKTRRQEDLEGFVVPDAESTTSLAPAAAATVVEDKGKLNSKKTKLKTLTHARMVADNKGDLDIKLALKRIDNMMEDDVDFGLHKIEFTNHQQFTTRLAEMLKNGTGWLADKALGAEGNIQSQFAQDSLLRNALSSRLLGMVGLLGLSAQIGLLMSYNVVQGLNNKANLNLRRPFGGQNMEAGNNNSNNNNVKPQT